MMNEKEVEESIRQILSAEACEDAFRHMMMTDPRLVALTDCGSELPEYLKPARHRIQLHQKVFGYYCLSR